MCTFEIQRKCLNLLTTFFKESYGITDARYKVQLVINFFIHFIVLICIQYLLVGGYDCFLLYTFTVLDILVFVVRRMCMKMLIHCFSAKASKSIERFLLVLASLLSLSFLHWNFPNLTWIVIVFVTKRYTFKFILWFDIHIPLVLMLKQPEKKQSKLIFASTVLFSIFMIYVSTPLSLIRHIEMIRNNTYCKLVKTDGNVTIIIHYTEIDVKFHQDVTSSDANSKSQINPLLDKLTNIHPNYKFKTYVFFISKWTYFEIKNLILPKEFNDDEVSVGLHYLTHMKHADTQRTACLTCRTPNKTCETSGTSKKCYLSFLVYHAYDYGDYQIILHRKNATLWTWFFHPLRIRLLPMIDHFVLDLIPNIFLSDSQRLAAEIARNESALLTDDVVSLIYSIDTEVFAVDYIKMVYLFFTFCGISIFYFTCTKWIVRNCDNSKLKYFDHSKRVYDIYISFSEDDLIDRNFVQEFLTGYLKECGFLVKSCQDVEAGRNLLREYSIEIPRSKKVLIVWSSAYEADETCFSSQFESIILEHRRQGNFRKEDVFILVIDEHELPSNYILLLERNNIYDIKALPNLTDIAIKAELKPLLTDIRESLKDIINL